MIRKNRFSLHYYIGFLGLITHLMGACTDNTSSLGLYPEEDELKHSSQEVQFTTKTIPMGAVRTASETNYLGDLIDPETNTRIHADFVAQFHATENYAFPKMEAMFPSNTESAAPIEHGINEIHCDSVEVRLYFESYYGESDNPMKMEVFPLSKENILSEDSVFYSNIQLEQFVDANAEPLATKVFSPRDYILSDSELNSSTHSHNIRVVLPQEWGSQLMQAYYQNPEYFKDSYTFIRKIFPGFYFKIKSGSGNMITVSVGTLNVYFSYYSEQFPDSTLSGLARFASTPEVIQCTHFTNEEVHELADDSTCTYLKTPAALVTEVTLPVNDIMKGHEQDSLSKATLRLTRYQKEQQDDVLGTPSYVLLVRKQEQQSFFDEKRVSNSMTSYTTAFDGSTNSYTFSNICRLITYLYNEKKAGMEKEELDEVAWEKAHPDWNKCVVIPVKRSTTQDVYGNTQETSITHDMGLNSVKLMGGPKNPLNMQVLFSKFQ